MLIQAARGPLIRPKVAASGTQPSRVGSVLLSAAGGNTPSLTLPASGIDAGMLAIAFATIARFSGSPTISLSTSGYTAIGSSPYTSANGGNTNILYAWYKYMVGDEESASIAWTFDDSTIGENVVGWALYQNVHQTTPIEGIAIGQGADDPITFPSVSASNNNRLGIALESWSNDNPVLAAPSGGSGPSWTMINQATSPASTDRAMGLLQADFSSGATSSGHSDTTARSADSWNVLGFCLRPTGA